MPPPIDVYPYSIHALRAVLSKEAPASQKTVGEKGHLGYFEEYFKALEAKTIVIERAYTDRHWLEDYAAFYVRCLEKYHSRCVRLHFFSVAFERQDLFDAAVGHSGSLNGSVLQDAYLGYIVVKPLPETFIGRTCLRTYPKAVGGSMRYYPVTRKYEAHLLGFDLHVESLAFQEQDSVAAACATSALWSAFHGTGILFHHSILSPIEITKNATAIHPSLSRDVPNRGLSVLQMAEAVRRIGLSPEVLPVSTAEGLRVTVRAYLSAGIPIVLMGVLIDWTDRDKPRFFNDNPAAGHAVTITGYQLDPGLGQCLHVSDQPVELAAFNMPKLYVHDDQVGPFARMVFCKSPEQVFNSDGRPNLLPISFALQTFVQSPTRPRGSVFFVPESILLPLYHKIRLPLEEVQRLTILLASTVEKNRSSSADSYNERLSWDIQLVTVASLQRRLRGADRISADERLDLLQQQWPRFIWCVRAEHHGEDAIELFLDATDIPGGDYVLTKPVIYDAEVAALLP